MEPIRNNKRRYMTVIDKSTGEKTVHRSLMLTAKALGISTSCLRHYLSGYESKKVPETIEVREATEDEIDSLPKQPAKGLTCEVCNKTFSQVTKEEHEKSRHHQKKLLPPRPKSPSPESDENKPKKRRIRRKKTTESQETPTDK